MKLNNKRVIYVGFAFLLIQAFWIAYDAIVPLMLVNKFGMNQTWSGLIMALDNILAIFMLPVFGSISDKTKTKMGKRTPYILVGTICAVIAFFGLSFADYAQALRISEVAAMPGQYEETAESIKTQEFFWEQNATIINSEYSKSNSNNNNKLGKQVALRNYVSDMLFNKPYDSLSEDQKAAAKKWYSEINLNTTYLFDKDEGYLIYTRDAEGKIYKWTFAEDGTAEVSELPDGEKIGVGSENAYSILVTKARSEHAANMTYKNPIILIVFIFLLLLTLIAMSVFRSPAVALMPDVVVKPLRSKGNAIINLMGVVGGILILGLGALMGTDRVQNQLMSYVGYIGAVCGVMIAALTVFMLKVKEPEWNAEMLEEQAAIDAKEAILNKEKEGEESKKEKLGRGEFVSLIFILLSVAFWYMGYNGVYSKYSLYSINVLGKPYNLVLIAAQAVALIGFLPIGMLSGKIGRKKTILGGVALLTAAFFAACFVTRDWPDWVPFILFSLVGIGWAAINVNSFPMVVELAKGSDIGKYTGYYYTASMAAQIVTPFLSGIIMDAVGSMSPLLWYGTICVAISFVTMLFVRHGDSKPIPKESKLEYLDVGDD